MQNTDSTSPPSVYVPPVRHWTPDQIPFYVLNPMTVKVSATSAVKAIAYYALELCSKFDDPVEFFYIGASAGQQAAKAMGIFRYKVDELFEGRKTAVFRPNRVRVRLDSEKGEIVDAIYWEAFVVPTDALPLKITQK